MSCDHLEWTTDPKGRDVCTGCHRTRAQIDGAARMIEGRRAKAAEQRARRERPNDPARGVEPAQAPVQHPDQGGAVVTVPVAPWPAAPPTPSRTVDTDGPSTTEFEPEKSPQSTDDDEWRPHGPSRPWWRRAVGLT